MYFVYVLKSERDGSLYIGLMNNLERRLRQHNGGQGRATRWRAPYRLMLVEPFQARHEARVREKYYKAGSGREALKLQFGKHAGVAERQTRRT